jgi:hypothetical protein
MTSHSTGGAKDHTTAQERNAPGDRNTSAPSMARKDDPMATQDPAATPRQDPKLRVRRQQENGVPPDEDT